jgi:hypothetical protein
MADFVKLSIFGTVFEVTSRYVDLAPVGMGAFGLVCSAKDEVSALPDALCSGPLWASSGTSGMALTTSIVHPGLVDWHVCRHQEDVSRARGPRIIQCTADETLLVALSLYDSMKPFSAPFP